MIDGNAILDSFRMCGRFADGLDVTIGGHDECDCIEKLAEMTEQHSDLVWYSGYSDEDYVNGVYIGRGNFKYD